MRGRLKEEARKEGGGGWRKGVEPRSRRGSGRLELGGRGARPGVQQAGAVCRAAAGSCSRLGAPGPGEGERPLARSMSFSDSSATFLLNEVTAGAPSPEGWQESSGIWEKLQRGWGGDAGWGTRRRDLWVRGGEGCNWRLLQRAQTGG